MKTRRQLHLVVSNGRRAIAAAHVPRPKPARARRPVKWAAMPAAVQRALNTVMGAIAGRSK